MFFFFTFKEYRGHLNTRYFNFEGGCGRTHRTPPGSATDSFTFKYLFSIKSNSFSLFLIFDKNKRFYQFNSSTIIDYHQIKSFSFLTNQNLYTKTLFNIFNIRFIQKTFSFPNKSFSLFSNCRNNKNISHFFFIYFIESKSSFSSLQKTFLLNIHSTNLSRIYIEFLYSMIILINDIKIILSIK